MLQSEAKKEACAATFAAGRERGQQEAH